MFVREGSRYGAVLVILAALGCSPGERALEASDPRSMKAVESLAVLAPDDAFAGVVVPSSVNQVVAQVQGTVAEVEVGVGDTVADGDVVARLDRRPLQDELALAEAGVAGRVAEVALERVEHDIARREATSAEALREAGHLAGQELRVAEARVRKAKATLDVARAAVVRSRAERERVAHALEAAVVHAPTSGVVADLLVEPGQWVERGTPVVRLVSVAEVAVRFGVPPRRRAALGPGVALEVVDTEGASWQAVVTRVAPEIDPLTELIAIEAKLRVLGEAPPIGAAVGVRLADRSSGPRAALERERDERRRADVRH